MRVAETPQRSAYIFASHRHADEVVDHLRLWDRTAGLAARVSETTAPGDRVLLMCPPGPEFVYAFFACLLTGRIAVPVHLAVSGHQLASLTAIVRDSGAAAAIAPLSTVPIGDGQLGPGIRIIDADSAGAGTGFDLGAAAPGPEDIAFLQYTSGSTGSPKGVMVRHRNLMANLGLLRTKYALTPDNTIVSWLPPYHDMGLIQGALLPMFVGFPSVLLSPMTFLRNPLTWLRAISEHEHVVAGGPNLAYGLCAKRVSADDAARLDLSGWDIAFAGAEPVDPNTLRKFAAAFAGSGFRSESFVPMYGLAESTLYVCGGRPGAGPRARSYSIEDLDRGLATAKTPGRELLSVGATEPERIAVVDRETGQRCAEHRIGEIWLRGDSIAAGYWNKPAETARAFRATLADGDGTEYLRTGDLGFVSDGALYVSGRIKELMIVHGRNIFPQDVERTIVSGHPHLRPGGCAVFAAQIENEDRVMVVQELDETQRETAAALEGSIRDIVSRVHAISVHQVVFVGKGEVPKTTSGKIQRQRLRETYSTAAAR
ncbi:fatty acyl-AMP ligase [Nocardia inohanensis]|uniref:fatty acyl-AMP ligase n=1 Tax=Nocardia inohanensis TaxID=209246 RepID=UPI001471224D|nr:fatty acyl-AMP ligase [Nocardia inohanensis]